MNMQEFKDFIKKLEQLLAHDGIDEVSYKLFILRSLPEEHKNEASLSDIFSKSSINLLIEDGEQIINIGRGDSYIIGGDPVDFTDFRERYIEIFKEWEVRGWIKIDRNSDGAIKISTIE